MEIFTLITSFEAKILYYAFLFIATVFSTFLAVRSVTAPPTRRHQVVLFFTAVFFWSVYTVFGWRIINNLSAVPQVATTTPRAHEVLKTQPPGISITFYTPINFNNLHVYTYPEIDVTIQHKTYLSGLIPFGRTITITPKTTLPPGESVMVFLSDIKGPLTYDFGGEHLLELVSADLPTIERIEPSDSKADIPPTIEFTIHLTEPLMETATWSATTDPPAELSVKPKDDRTLTITPVKPFSQNTRYTMSIIQTPLILLNADKSIVERKPERVERKLTFRTVKPPFIQSFTPLGLSTNPKEPIKIIFEEPMEPSSVEKLLTVTPNIPLTYAWESNKQTLLLKHPELKKNTVYFLKIEHGMKTARGGISQNDAVFQFHTAGPVKIAASSPADKATGISVSSPITITFDQEIQAATVLRGFEITPDVAGKSVVRNNALEFTPSKPLSLNTAYTMRFAAGIGSVYGLPSDKDQTVTFTTQTDEIALSVPFFKQQESFTCNIAAARMLLAYRGITIDEAGMKNLTGSGGKRGSGNPHKGYIDDYGTYWEPIERAVSTFRPHRMITSGNISDIIAELKKGNPVMIWGQNGWSDPHDLSWTTAEGEFIKAVNGMHSSVVRGFLGPETNPTHVLLNDPWRGQYAIGVKEFMRRWSFFNVAMVVE